MMPTFKPEGDVVLVERISHRMNNLKPGVNLTQCDADRPQWPFLMMIRMHDIMPDLPPE